MKNTQVSMLFLLLLLNASTHSTCQKQVINPLEKEIVIKMDTTDNTIIEELAAVDVPDVIDPEPVPGTTKIDSIKGFRATTDEDALANCSTFKYAGFLKVGYGGNSTTLVMQLSQADTLDISSITSSKPELIKVTDLRKIDGTHWAFTIAAKTDTFRAASVKISVTNTKTSPTTFGKTIKVVGVNENVNTYGTQVWGLEYEGARLKGTYLPIDTNYVPMLGDVIKFGADIKGIISTTPVVTPPHTSGGIYQSTKYVFNLVQWNAKDCSSSRTVKRISTLKTDLPTGIKSADGVTAATHYKRR